jgi:hypothetical protein
MRRVSCGSKVHTHHITQVRSVSCFAKIACESDLLILASQREIVQVQGPHSSLFCLSPRAVIEIWLGKARRTHARYVRANNCCWLLTPADANGQDALFICVKLAPLSCSLNATTRIFTMHGWIEWIGFENNVILSEGREIAPTNSICISLVQIIAAISA